MAYRKGNKSTINEPLSKRLVALSAGSLTEEAAEVIQDDDPIFVGPLEAARIKDNARSWSFMIVLVTGRLSLSYANWTEAFVARKAFIAIPSATTLMKPNAIRRVAQFRDIVADHAAAKARKASTKPSL